MEHARTNSTTDDAIRIPPFGLDRQRVEAVAQGQLSFLDRHAALFDERIREGRIVEGHGDLRPEHVCLEPVAAILEFYRSRRILRRAKIAIWHLREPDSPRRQRYADRARRYLEIARPWVG